MKFSDAGGAVAGVGEQDGQALHAVEGLKVMLVVLQAIHAIAVVLLAREDDGPRRAAARGGAEGVREARAIGREGVEMRRLDHGVAIGAEGVEAMIVGDDQYDIGARGGGELGGREDGAKGRRQLGQAEKAQSAAEGSGVHRR